MSARGHHLSKVQKPAAPCSFENPKQVLVGCSDMSEELSVDFAGRDGRLIAQTCQIDPIGAGEGSLGGSAVIKFTYLCDTLVIFAG